MIPWEGQEFDFNSEDGEWACLHRVLKDAALARCNFSLPERFSPYDEKNKDLTIRHNLAVLKAFRRVLPVGEVIQVIDFHHQNYLFNPHLPVEENRTQDDLWGFLRGPLPQGYSPLWPVSVIPEGDDVDFFFPKQKMVYGYRVPNAGSCSQIHVIGAPLIDALKEANSPLLTE